MKNIIEIVKDNKTEFWYDMTDFAKMIGNDVKNVSVLLTTGDGKGALADAIAEDIQNRITENKNAEIVCECMKITFKDGSEVTIKEKQTIKT